MSMFAEYNPYMGQPMSQFQTGQQPVDARYMNDPLIQKLLASQAQSQIINAFAPQQGMGGFLDGLFQQTQAPAPTTPAPSVPDALVNPFDQSKNPKKWRRWNSQNPLASDQTGML